MQIETEFFPGSIGAIATFHGEYYARHWGFGTFFEAKVATELSAFALRKTEEDLVLLARDGDGLIASLILDLNDPESGERGAHFRWFFTADRCRGTGLGRRFMATAMTHVDTFSAGRSWLTTFAGLDTARALYEAHGYTLEAESDGAAWGVRVKEQEFRRDPGQR